MTRAEVAYVLVMGVVFALAFFALPWALSLLYLGLTA